MQYWEPQPAIELNNLEAVLAAEELERETEVLVLLTQLVRLRWRSYMTYICCISAEQLKRETEVLVLLTRLVGLRWGSSVAFVMYGNNL